MTWGDYLYRTLRKVGFSPSAAAFGVAAIIVHDGPEPHAVFQPNGLPTFALAINSDRIRTSAGIAIVLDLPALRRAFEIKP